MQYHYSPSPSQGKGFTPPKDPDIPCRGSYGLFPRLDLPRSTGKYPRLTRGTSRRRKRGNDLSRPSRHSPSFPGQSAASQMWEFPLPPITSFPPASPVDQRRRECGKIPPPAITLLPQGAPPPYGPGDAQPWESTSSGGLAPSGSPYHPIHSVRSVDYCRYIHTRV